MACAPELRVWGEEAETGGHRGGRSDVRGTAKASAQGVLCSGTLVLRPEGTHQGLALSPEVRVPEAGAKWTGGRAQGEAERGRTGWACGWGGDGGLRVASRPLLPQ